MALATSSAKCRPGADGLVRAARARRTASITSIQASCGFACSRIVPKKPRLSFALGSVEDPFSIVALRYPGDRMHALLGRKWGRIRRISVRCSRRADHLRNGRQLWPAVMTEHAVRLTDVNTICAELRKRNKLVFLDREPRGRRRITIAGGDLEPPVSGRPASHAPPGSVPTTRRSAHCRKFSRSIAPE